MEFLHLNIVPMTLYNDIVPDFNEVIHVYGCYLSILLCPLKNMTSLNYTIVNFGQPVSKFLHSPVSILLQVFTLSQLEKAFCLINRQKWSETIIAMLHYLWKFLTEFFLIPLFKYHHK